MPRQAHARKKGPGRRHVTGHKTGRKNGPAQYPHKRGKA